MNIFDPMSEESDSCPRTEDHDLVNTVVDESKLTVRSDKWNYAWLTFIYINQGILRGLVLQAVPLIIKENGATDQELANFWWAELPSQLKLAMAPIVECFYFRKMGKRKSWLILCQYLMGIIGILSSVKIDTWIGSKGQASSVSVVPLIVLLFLSDLLLTLSDMVTDTWSLSMLRRENVGYQASCNIIGNRLGSIIGYIVLILLRSKNVSELLGQETPILSVSGYLFTWSTILLISNTIVFIFKEDTTLEVMGKSGEKLSIGRSYKLIWDLLKLKSIRRLAVLLLFCPMGIAFFHKLLDQKLTAGGMRSEDIVLLGIPLAPLQAILPFILRRHFEGSQGLERYARTLLYMTPVGIMYSALIFFMPDLKNSDGGLTPAFYVMYFIIHGIDFMVFFLLMTAYLSFMAKICDPKHGAVYLMTVHTIGRLGFAWPSFLSGYLLGPLTILKGAGCVKELDRNKCILVDGFHIFVLIGSLFNISFFYFGGAKAMKRVQNLNADKWQIAGKVKDVHNMKIIKSKTYAPVFINFNTTRQTGPVQILLYAL